MYKDIEKLYKKGSPYNIIMIKTFRIYVILILFSLIFNFLDKTILMILIFIALCVILKTVSEKVLNTKLYFKIVKKKENEEILPTIIRNKEKEIFKKYSMDNNLYNEKTLLCIVEHYRNKTKTKMVGGNLLAIFSIAIPILLSFYTKDGFDFNGLSNALTYLICFCIMILIIYFLYNQFTETKKLLKGEYEMPERLEEIFSELYAEYVYTNNSIKKHRQKGKIKS